MARSLLLGAVLGGLTAFVWSFISYGVLPWHLNQYHSFQNEDDLTHSSPPMHQNPESTSFLWDPPSRA
jgi:hypothetical protein